MNKPSGKISPEENDKVFQMLGDRRQSLSTAVVQLLLANQSSTRQWQLVVTGVACFVKDSVRRGYFIQVFDMDNCQRIWEQELYNEMVYKNPTSTFHTFEGDSTTVGLSFADNREAEEFKAAVIERIERIKQRSASRAQSQKQDRKRYPREVLSAEKSNMAIDYNGNVKINESSLDKKEKKPKKYWSLGRKKDKSKPKITKNDISLPKADSFVHINGAASSEIYRNQNSSQFKDQNNFRNFKRPPPPPPPYSREDAVRNDINKRPEGSNSNEALTQISSDSKNTTVAKKTGPPNCIPPPPPPPPLPSNKPPITIKSKPQLPSMAKKESNILGTTDAKADLMEEIRRRACVKGSGLRPRPPPNTPTAPTCSSNSVRCHYLMSPSMLVKSNSTARSGTENTKNELMEAIRQKGGYQGGCLKHVQPADKNANSDSSDSNSAGSLFNVLNRELAKIRKATANSDSSESSSSDEWSEEEIC